MNVAEPFRTMASSLASLLPTVSFWDQEASDLDYDNISSKDEQRVLSSSKLMTSSSVVTSLLQHKFKATNPQNLITSISSSMESYQSDGQMEVATTSTSTGGGKKTMTPSTSSSIGEDEDIRRLCDAFASNVTTTSISSWADLTSFGDEITVWNGTCGGIFRDAVLGSTRSDDQETDERTSDYTSRDTTTLVEERYGGQESRNPPTSIYAVPNLRKRKRKNCFFPSSRLHRQ